MLFSTLLTVCAALAESAPAGSPRPVVFDPPLDGPLSDELWPEPDPWDEHEVCPATADSIRAEADYAIDRLRRGDQDAFTEHAAAVVESLGCMTQVITPRTAEHIHMVQGLRKWAEGDPGAAARAWQGVVAICPDLQPAPELVPVGSRQAALFESARSLGDGRQQELNSGFVYVDGSTRREFVPWQRGAVVQRLGEVDPASQQVRLDGLSRPHRQVLTWYLWGTGGISEDLLGAKPKPVSGVDN